MKEPAASSKLLPRALRELRARAHALKPVVWISQNGMSDGAMREIDRALAAHELVKIHAEVDGRRDRAELLDALCTALDAQPVQVIGKMLIAFRPRVEPQVQEKPRAAPPGPRGAAARARPRRQAPSATPARRGESRRKTATRAR